jgi:hypothetical protein
MRWQKELSIAVCFFLICLSTWVTVFQGPRVVSPFGHQNTCLNIISDYLYYRHYARKTRYVYIYCIFYSYHLDIRLILQKFSVAH